MVSYPAFQQSGLKKEIAQPYGGCFWELKTKNKKRPTKFGVFVDSNTSRNPHMYLSISMPGCLDGSQSANPPWHPHSGQASPKYWPLPPDKPRSGTNLPSNIYCELLNGTNPKTQCCNRAAHKGYCMPGVRGRHCLFSTGVQPTPKRASAGT